MSPAEVPAEGCPADTDVAAPPWAMVLRSCLEPVARLRWQIATVGALGLAALSWLPVWSGAKAPVESERPASIVTDAATEELAQKEEARAAPATAVGKSEVIPGLAQARALTADQMALRAPIPTPPGLSRDTAKTVAPAVPAPVAPAPPVRSEAAPVTTAARPHGTPKVRSEPKDAPTKSIARRSKSKSKKKKKQDDSMLAKVSRSVQDFFGGDKRR